MCFSSCSNLPFALFEPRLDLQLLGGCPAFLMICYVAVFCSGQMAYHRCSVEDLAPACGCDYITSVRNCVHGQQTCRCTISILIPFTTSPSFLFQSTSVKSLHRTSPDEMPLLFKTVQQTCFQRRLIFSNAPVSHRYLFALVTEMKD